MFTNEINDVHFYFHHGLRDADVYEQIRFDYSLQKEWTNVKSLQASAGECLKKLSTSNQIYLNTHGRMSKQIFAADITKFR